eukprot:720966-Pleurochrysis_carterae.AAC.1
MPTQPRRSAGRPLAPPRACDRLAARNDKLCVGASAKVDAHRCACMRQPNNGADAAVEGRARATCRLAVCRRSWSADAAETTSTAAGSRVEPRKAAKVRAMKNTDAPQAQSTRLQTLNRQQRRTPQLRVA